MSGFVCMTDDMHPYECDGPGKCLHCDREDNDRHDPITCALCLGDVGEAEATS